MLKQIFSHQERAQHVTALSGTGGFIPFSETEMAAVLGGGEETRPYITVQSGHEENSTQTTSELQ
ncbi:hypothetical protein CLV51_101810 [Chitinophaga niastensis]|uniref:Uncharacterized protein n=1 Tax=Chitinophaga niastensis TaxID=536980 RepID=A0A2P8HTD2_CHINA|nr:hypothetical protein [Chitinophaga niastensis]PSL49477.1 hypothetical protein CLV51_101810 [Chitinophaga niastensis]